MGGHSNIVLITIKENDTTGINFESLYAFIDSPRWE